jgi:ribonuclease P protein component
MKFTLRIKKGKTFKYILRKGSYNSGKYLITHVCKTKYDNNVNFFGVCVSKKNGNSVERNKLKRWVREVYKNEESALKKNYSIVILFKKTCYFKNVNFSKIVDDIQNCFRELDLYE